LRVDHGCVGDQGHSFDPPLRSGEAQRADPARAEGVGGDTPDIDIDRFAGIERSMQRPTPLGLDAGKDD
jgi:hypothetical protein